ncbi:hypothetical protein DONNERLITTCHEN_00700 [Janthinobacterium phage vB_JliS-Donnerlittchen]|uniref:Virion structural protein n=1 Tax=Janthinobacterium phage vB_JliS-Donnerlittchen TaxID=2948610 RepID=A0A9E7SK22_9CAUD|nr:hypothetical protein P9A49_gp66 [Janthinobacterium phage vB_JliM-Donnerlittchen]USN14470.1 hypothetical protein DONNERLITTCHEN_00700 [Janthinobacterium phage vB_JliM-Donnerlittchen]
MEFEFAKNTTVDTLDKVPEQFRGMYAEGDGGYVLNDAFKGTASAVDGLNKSLKAARRDADEAKRNRPDITGFAQVGQLLGLDGDDATSPETLRQAVERVIGESKDGKVNWDKMKKDLERGFQTQLQGKDGELQTMSKTLQKYLVTTAAVQAIAGQKGVPELLLPHIQAKTKVIKEGDEYVVRVVDETGDPRGNASGGFMTVEDLVKEMKASPTFGRAFESEAPAGSGVKPGATQQKPGQQRRELSPTEKIAAGLAKRR